MDHVGSAGHKLSVIRDINQNGDFYALYPNYGSIIQLNSIGNSNYNSLQTVLKVRTWHGFGAQFGYTWSHALDEVTEYRGAIPFDSFNLRQEYGSGHFDTCQNFTAYWSYDIPGGSRGPKWLTRGSQVSGFGRSIPGSLSTATLERSGPASTSSEILSPA